MGNLAAKKRNSHLKVAAGLAVSLLCLWWVLRFIDLSKLLEVLQASNGLYIASAFAIMVFSYVFRSIRWPYFFANNAPEFKISYRCLIVGFFMNNVLPARIGELVRAHIGGRATNQSRALVLATIAGERLVDGLTISLFFAILFSYSQTAVELSNHQAEHLLAVEQGIASLSSNHDTPSLDPVMSASIEEAKNVKYGQAMYMVSLLFLVAGIATMLLLAVRHRIFALLEKLSHVMPGHVSRYSLRRARLFIEGLEPMFDKVKLPYIVFFSFLVWSIELFVFYLISLAFNQPMDLGALGLFLAVVNFSSLIPAAPGGIGVIELLATMALTGIGIDAEVAFAMVLSQHVIQLLVVGLPGAYFFFSMLGGRVPTSEEDPDLAEAVNGDEPYADVSEPEPIEDTSSSITEDFVEHDEAELVDISVVIPAYNEENRLPKTLLSVLEFLRERGGSFEVIVVDDGSVDNTAGVVRQTAALAPQLRLLSCPGNCGKGYAVRLGILKSKGRIVLFNDADGATPIEEMERLLKAINAGAHVAIGSRALMSRETNVDATWLRKFLGRVFNGAVNLLVLPGIPDTQSGFKMFVRPVARYAFSKQKAKRFSFDVEVLFLARKTGCKIIEVPVNWHHVPGSKINLILDAAHMLFDVITVRLRHLLGGYGERVSISELMKER